MRAYFSAAIALFAVVIPAAAAAQNGVVAFKNATVFPMDRDVQLDAHTIVVSGGRITAVGPNSAVNIPPGALEIDASGRFIIPGLAEMHAHVPGANAPPAIADRVLTLFALNGVTTARGMLGDPSHLVLRERLASGAQFGPRLITSGPSFNGNSVTSAARAVDMVVAQKEAGFDLLKIHPGVPRAAFDSVAATAQRVGIPFSGHVPLAVGWQRALEARYSTIDHVDGFIEALLADGAPMTVEQGGFFGLGLVDHLDMSRVPALVKATKEAGVAMVPTAALLDAWVDDTPADSLAARPEMRYWLPNQIASWRMNKENLLNAGPYTPAQRAKFVVVRRTILKALHDGGVTFLLGSDAPQVWNVPGFSVHRELAALVDAGFSPYDALRTGTANVAEFYGERVNSGVIAVGRDADLILLDRNPLNDSRNTQTIAGVMVRGTWVSGAERASRLEALAQQ